MAHALYDARDRSKNETASPRREELAKLPAETKDLQLSINDAGLLTITRDGVEIASKQLP